MTDIVQLPPASEARHRAIAQRAAENLGRLAEGNGLKADQIRLAREETVICRIPAAITVRLVTEVLKTRVPGKAPEGVIVATAADVEAVAASQLKDALKDDGLQREVSEALRKDAGRGFGMDQAVISLPLQQKEVSVITTCPTCRGAAYSTCSHCGGSGSASCLTCQGSGSSPCQWCHGMAYVQDAQGASVPCTRCQNGRIICPSCRGQRLILCIHCRGQGKLGCTECGQTGSITEIYKIGYKAQCSFDMDWRETPTEVKAAAHKLGLRELATKQHAEILWQPPEAEADSIVIPCIVFLPLARVEFLAAEGKVYPALVAGLRGRILEIEPLLDKYVKPGVAALMKLSQGPMARHALIETACRYRLIRQVLAGLARSSRKNIYQGLCKNYPLVLSDKYARATVKYAANAMNALSTGPRYKGLAAGTALATLLAAVYYLTPLRHILLMQILHYIFAVDIAVWLASCAIAIYTIKLMTAQALRKLLPSVSMEKKRLPAAGSQGLAAFLTTAIACSIVAACAPEKPEWILFFLR